MSLDDSPYYQYLQRNLQDAFIYYYDNPKGKIPTWLINWVAKTGLPRFLGTMRKAVGGYKNFLEAKRKERGLEILTSEQRLQELYKTLMPDK